MSWIAFARWQLIWAGARQLHEPAIERVMRDALTLIGNTQEPTAQQREIADYHIMSGGLRVGRVCMRKSAMSSQPQWLWDINGVHAAPGVMRLAGTTTTLEQAQAELKANWGKWLAWAALQPIADPTASQPTSTPNIISE